uniref:Ankyrin repeat and FYVE domain-containing protein 1 n=1 Tax=Mucochytrium quahogii TaxID=96639 RepID=A0A7S2RPC1_9STRA|mmetsp:Transcript_7367/g.11783  ORF Transcript_7367/g.11783 Transcript_7367/m.11783 type:complete len:981 (-) Transcript_7367:397-3339(-)|eukprot:CAMPEP_0203747772 /NCGR_PEP_ID=MMETSP0098-20131031/2829_1 /ASSEMBLY_ACC=CAM_ASM_000208 /TAXON_ID=96639 /ORGANISM=" , Strain NY0313808BC1" /LENGTH=980 /DNA_ID=CAMNT_0050636315 /DNA_START=271 /DNA_END=3213 /DNA_ORIENTATION=+
MGDARLEGSLEEDFRGGLKGLFDSHELSDAKIHGFVDENGVGTLKQIPVHRLVLCIRSPVFRERFKIGGAWFGRNEIKCEVSNYDVMRTVVKFIYTDELLFEKIDLPFFAKVYEAARIFEIEKLLELSRIEIVNGLRSTKGGFGWFTDVLTILQFAARGRVPCGKYYDGKSRRLSTGSTSSRGSNGSALNKTRPFDGCIDEELSMTCLGLLRETVTAETDGKPRLLRALHDKIENILDPLSDVGLYLSPCICSDVLVDIFPGTEAMHCAVLSGRSDVVVDLLAQGVDPDTPSMDGVLPVETALQLGKTRRFREISTGSTDTYDDGEDSQVKSFDPIYDRGSPVASFRFAAPKISLPFPVDWVTCDEMDQIVETLILGGSKQGHGKATKKNQQQPMLNLAAKLGNARHVQALLDVGTDVNERDPVSGRSPLHCAAESGYIDVLNVLLAAGAVPNQQDANGCTALHLAARRGHVGVVEILQPVVNENIPDRFGWTALHHAARKGQAEVTRRILQQSKDPVSLILATEYDQGSTAVHLAATNAHYRVILVILDCSRERDENNARDYYFDYNSGTNAQDGSDQTNRKTTNTERVANARDIAGRSPLHRAATTACDAITGESQSGELFQRASKVIETLIDAGASILSTTKLDYVPLHFALGGLKCHKLSPNSQNPGQAAAEDGSFGPMRQRTQNELGPLEREQNKNSTRLMSILLGAVGGRASIRACGKDGVTPLHCAVRYGHIRAVSILVRRGAEVNARDVLGQSPLSIAREFWPLPLLANALLKLIPSPPTWVEDSQASECEACGSTFSVTHRRHHCRHCSSLFCASCAGHFMPIPKYGIEKSVRVCSGCHEALSWPTAMEVDEDLDCSFSSSESDSGAEPYEPYEDYTTHKASSHSVISAQDLHKKLSLHSFDTKNTHTPIIAETASVMSAPTALPGSPPKPATKPASIANFVPVSSGQNMPKRHIKVTTHRKVVRRQVSLQ